MSKVYIKVMIGDEASCRTVEKSFETARIVALPVIDIESIIEILKAKLQKGND